MEWNRKAEKYIRHIRNKSKQEYARAYYNWMRRGERGEPPQPKYISTMASQAVRIMLQDIQEGRE
jgi:hypothetical protein